MLRLTITCLLSGAVTAACVHQPTDQTQTRYCSVRSYEPCLEQVRTGNCQPCPTTDQVSRP
jgi:hypothetical protein